MGAALILLTIIAITPVLWYFGHGVTAIFIIALVILFIILRDRADAWKRQ